MKKTLLALSTLVSFSAIAASAPTFNNLSKDDVKNVSKEFGANFAHTAVAAPETDGVWGLEVGVIAGQTGTPKFSDVVDASGGDGSDFKNVYHAGAMARVHLPFELFVEGTLLPSRDISDVNVKSSSFGIGWNVGGFFELPVDLAVGIDHGKGKVKFHQDLQGLSPEADISLETKTTNAWVGVSKTFWFFTPYAKAGVSKIKSDLDSTGQIFGFTAKQSESTNMNGGYFAVGANFQFLIFKFGIEGTQIQNAKKATAKFSFDF